MLAAMRPKVAPFRVAPPFGVDAAIPVPAHQQPPVDAPENGSLKKLLNKPAAIEAEREKKQEHQLPNGPGPPEYDVLDEGAKEGGIGFFIFFFFRKRVVNLKLSNSFSFSQAWFQ